METGLRMDERAGTDGEPTHVLPALRLSNEFAHGDTDARDALANRRRQSPRSGKIGYLMRDPDERSMDPEW